MLINDNKESILSSIISSIIKHIGSFVIGVIITALVYYIARMSFYVFMNSIFELKPLAIKLFDLGILALAINWVLIAGTVNVPKGHIGVLTVLQTRQEGKRLTEGYTWLGPSFLLGCEIESIRAQEIFVQGLKFSSDLISVRFDVAYTYNVVNAINYDNNFKRLDKNSLRSGLEESIRDKSISMFYLDSILTNGLELSNLLIEKANNKFRSIWGIEIQTASVSQIETSDPKLLNIYARVELEIRETMLDLYKRKMEISFYTSAIEDILKRFKSQLNASQIIDLLKHLINQVKYYRFDVNMDDETKSFFENVLNKTKEKFS